MICRATTMFAVAALAGCAPGIDAEARGCGAAAAVVALAEWVAPISEAALPLNGPFSRTPREPFSRTPREDV